MCSEQLIQATKSVFCGDQHSLKLIMEAKTPLECKSLGKEITNCNTSDWNKAAKELCYPGILAKFQQNPGLAAFLKNTGDRTILECCYDETWGNGMSLSNPQCIDPLKYKKQDMLGEMLEDICTVLKAESISSTPPICLMEDATSTSPVQT